MAEVDERTRERYEPRWPEADPAGLPARRPFPVPWMVGGAVALGLVLLGFVLAEFMRLPSGFLLVFFFVGPWWFFRRRRRR